MMAVVVASPAAADIVGFNPATDRLDFGDVSVHNLIVAKTEAGEPAIVNPWAWSPQFQVMKGVGFGQLSAETFGVVQNEHLRQDIGGVLSWEKGVGPRLAGTVYVRSHEYGMQEKVVGFDPAANKLSFLYFGTRERLSVTDTAEGLLISVEPTKQSLLLVGVTKASLVPGNLEFHHDQVIEDQLEVPFGVTSDQVALVSRAALLTPNGPAGQPTDGWQTRAGMTGAVTTPTEDTGHDNHDHSESSDCCAVCGMEGCTHDHGAMPTGGEAMPATGILMITWAWNEQRAFGDFNPATDVLALDWFSGGELRLTEEQGSAVLAIPAMQQSYTLLGVPLSRLTNANFTFKDLSAGAYLT